MKRFELISNYKPAGDQIEAIKKLVQGFKENRSKQILLGVTGSGKTFTVSNVIQQLNKPTLIIAHNKTLAAQLYHEFKEFFPNNKVEYFVSYYDYYQPESYLPASDTYIEKDLSVNPKIEQMRLSATKSLLTRDDVIIISSVSCIYGLGDPEEYKNLGMELEIKKKIKRSDLLKNILLQQYERTETDLFPGKFRVKGDVIDIIPAYSEDLIRIELFGDEIEKITILDRINLTPIDEVNYYYLFPARHFVMSDETKERALKSIRKELEQELPKIEDPLIQHRLKKRVNYDIEMIDEIGYCKGVENYSRHFENRKPGEPANTLLDYFPDDFLLIIDESHQTIPQLGAMYRGDRSRKDALIEYGFRLPCAYDNRPLQFHEFEKFQKNVIYVSATPGNYELDHTQNTVEQLIRPTGLVDPEVITRPIKGQIDDIINEIRTTKSKNFRTLITTLTKRMAEELTDHLSEKGIKVRYLHSEIDTLERTELIRQLRAGEFDVLVGINLLREGLDIPEVALVAILDADKEGFLRDTRSLIQTIGRAARNTESKVILYCDKITDSIHNALKETKRRRDIQIAYNKKHNITPISITKPIKEQQIILKDTKSLPKTEIQNLIEELKKRMETEAENLNFENAILIRDQIKKLEKEVKK